MPEEPPPPPQTDDDGPDIGIEPAAPVPSVVSKVANPPLRVLLRLPLVHRLLSGSLMLLTVTGRKTGDTYTFPVGYERHDGAVWVTTHETNWWKNLRERGQRVTVHLRGRRREGDAELIEDPMRVADYLKGYLERNGIERHARRAGLKFERDDVPDRRTLALASGHVVVVRIDLE